MQKLIIRNFGPISHAEIEITRLSVLIGPQASGKSTIVKAVFFFKLLRDRLLEFILDKQDQLPVKTSDFSKEVRRLFSGFWGAIPQPSDLYLHYEYRPDIWLEITLTEKHGYVSPTFSPRFIEEYDRLFNQLIDKRPPKNQGIFQRWEGQIIQRVIKSQVDRIFGFEHELFFIPAGRSLVTTLSEQISKVSANQLDPLITQFMDIVLRARHYFSKSLEEIIDEYRALNDEIPNEELLHQAQQTIDRIIKGSYRSAGLDDRLYYAQDRFTLLKYASSGQQESIWIAYLIFLFLLENRSVFVVFEEPEAHLYPEAQREIVRLIVLLLNKNGNQGMITTHSPYILAALNNHLYAHQVARTYQKEVEALMPRPLWLDPQQSRAIFVDRGCPENIMADDLNQIRAEAIDSASTLINEEYEALFDLDDLA